MRLTARTALVTGATGELGRAIARAFAGRRSWSVHDLHAWEILSPLRDRYLPWSSSAMRPSGLVVVLNDICFHGRTRIVECGGGVSTICIARLLRERGGKLVTLENEERWAAYIAAEIEREGLGEHAEVRLAPLEGTPGSAGRLFWYAHSAVQSVISALERVELLVVDGPAVQDHDEMVRYPALSAFAAALTDDCTVVLDDIERRGEQHVAERWERESDIRFRRLLDPGGIAVGRRPGHSFIGI